MKIVSEVETQQEFDEIKSIMEVFVVNHRIHMLTSIAQNYSDPFPKIFFILSDISLLLNYFQKYLLLNGNLNNSLLDYNPTSWGST